LLLLFVSRATAAFLDNNNNNNNNNTTAMHKIILFALLAAWIGFASGKQINESSFSELASTIGKFWLSKLHVQSAVSSTLSSISDLPDHEGISVGDASSMKHTSLRRSLQQDYFDELNEMLKAVTVRAPDTKVQQKILWNDLHLDLKNIRCYDISLQDVRVSYQQINNKEIEVPIELVGLDLWCELDWRYKWGIFHDGGSAQMYTDDNSAKTVLAFTSQNFLLHAPNGSSVKSCEPNIRITNIDISGDFVAQVVNVMEGVIRGTVANAVEGVLCEELGSLGSSAISDVISMIDEMIEEHKGTLSQAIANPLAAERKFVSRDVEIVDLTDSTTSFGSLLDLALDEADRLLGSVTDDPNSPTGNGKDLGVNKLLRSTILDEDRKYVVPISSWPASVANGGVIFTGHDLLTETTIVMNEMRLLGLDTFTVFDPLNRVGRLTLANSFKLDYLTFEADLTISMKPSSHSDAVIVNSNGDREAKIERITVRSGMRNLELDLTFLLALNQDALGNIQLGSILQSNQIIPCLLGTVHAMEITGLGVSIDDIDTPSMTGFISKGLDKILRTAAELAFVMYKAPLLSAAPNFFQTTVRRLSNDLLKNQIEVSSSDDSCPTYGRDASSLVDFRELFLAPRAASNLGGAGNALYGDVGPMLMNIFKEQIFSEDSGGISKINSMLIRPMTKAQSGTDGTLRFVSDLFSYIKEDIDNLFWSSFAESLVFSIYNGKIENIDTVRDLILQPSSNPTELENSFRIGYDDESFFRDVEATSSTTARSLKGSVRTLLDIGGITPLAMSNNIDIEIEAPDLGFLVKILAPIREKALMEFPMKAIMNLNCWLATLSPSDIVELNSQELSFALSELFLSLASVRLNMACVECTSPGFTILPDVINTLEDAGAIMEMKNRVVEASQELLKGEWVQTQVARHLIDSAKKCPHHALYREAFSSGDWPSLGLPSISQNALELLLMSGAIFLQAGFVVVAESHSDVNLDKAEPLAGQNTLDTESSDPLVDFSDLSSSIGALGGFVDSVRSRFGEVVRDTTGPNAETTREDLYVNVLLRDGVLDDTRALSLPLGDIRIDTNELSFALHSIRILGLDTFTQLDILRPIAKQTLMNEIRLKHIDVEIDISVISPAANRMLIGDEQESIKISFGLDDVSADIALLFALDLDLIGSLELGSILHSDKILPCILSASRAVELSQLSISVGDIKEPTIMGFISNDAVQVIQSTTEAIFSKYKTNIVTSIPAIFDMTIRPLVNGILSNYVTAESNRSCPSAVKSENSDFINFHDLLLPASEASEKGGRGNSPYGDIFRYLMRIIEEHVLATDSNGLSKINDIVFGPVTESQSGVPGSLLYPGDVFGGVSDVNVGGFQAKVEVRAFDASIENINTVGNPLNLLEPISNEPNSLQNIATLGAGQRPLRGSVGFLLSIMGDSDDNLQMRNELVISVDLSAATIIAETLIQIKEEAFLSFPLRDMLNVNCWLATMPTAELNEYGVRSTGSKASLALETLAVTIKSLQLDVECVSCTSPGFNHLAQMLSSPEGIEDATMVANRVTNYVTSLLGGEFVETKIDRILYNAERMCPHHRNYDATFVAPSSYKDFDVPSYTVAPLNFLLALLIVGCTVFVFVAVMALIIKCIVRRRHRRWISTLSQDEISNIYSKQFQALKEEREISRRTKSLATSGEIPLFVRILMPLIVVGNIGLFLSGHLSLGATVSIKAEIAGEVLNIGEFFKFSMAYSVAEMWNAGAKSLAVLILIFSGALPYAKQVITFVLWFLPPSYCATTRRGKIFLWLDALAKWSMVDIFVLLCTLAAFRISIQSPEGLVFLPDNFYKIDLAVIPLFGLYANMTAQLISQVSSHFIIYYHRRVVSRATIASFQDKSSGDNQHKDTRESLAALCNHRFQTDFHSKGRLGTVRSSVNKAVLISSVTIMALIIAGCTLYSFSLEVLGLIGIAVESGQDFAEAKTSHNLFSLVGVIMEEARFLNVGRFYVGLGTLSALLILTTLIVPIAQAWCLVWQWLGHFSKKGRYRIHVAIECLSAWQYIEVYVLSVIIMSWQISGVSSFMVNAYCGSLTPTLKEMAYYGVIDPVDAQCFGVEARLDKGVYVLIAGSLILSILNSFVRRAADQRDDEEHMKCSPIEDLEESKLEGNMSSRSEDVYTDQDDHGIKSKSSRIAPVAVRFTDTYKCLLTYHDNPKVGSISDGRNGEKPSDNSFLRHTGTPHTIQDELESSEESIVGTPQTIEAEMESCQDDIVVTNENLFQDEMV